MTKEETKAYNKIYYAKNKEALRAHNKAYYHANKEAQSKQKKCYRDKNKEYLKEQKMKYNYGINKLQYEELLSKRARCCWSCGSSDLLCIDHCHIKDSVRGILCSQCNTALGLLKEDPVRIRALADYIESFR